MSDSIDVIIDAYSDAKYSIWGEIGDEYFKNLPNLKQWVEDGNGIFDSVGIDFFIAQKLQLYDIIWSDVFVPKNAAGEELISFLSQDDHHFVLDERMWKMGCGGSKKYTLRLSFCMTDNYDYETISAKLRRGENCGRFTSTVTDLSD